MGKNWRRKQQLLQSTTPTLSIATGRNMVKNTPPFQGLMLLE